VRHECPLLCTPAQASAGADTGKAAAKNDWWLFIATLVVLGVFIWFILRSFMGQHEHMITDHVMAISFQ